MESGVGFMEQLMVGVRSSPEDARRSEWDSVMDIPGGWECEFGSRHQGLLMPV